MDAAEAARHWADVWQRAWPVGDTDAISALYAEDAVFYSHPFRDRQAPAEYVAWAFGDQASAECRFGDPVAAGTRAAVDWWAVITDRDGSEQTVAGTSLLRFGGDGRVVEQRDAWGEEPGRRELPDWAA
jgi:hypothetical protein